MKKQTRRLKKRRGVLLLVVLSILVMFILLGMTYFMVATQYRQSTTHLQRIESTGDDPQKELDDALGQLVRDTLNPDSVLKGHSLLADKIGYEGFVASVASAKPVLNTGNQFIDVEVNPNTLIHLDGMNHINATSSPYQISMIDDSYAGLTLTFTSGSAQGLATRIVRYFAPNSLNTLPTFRLMILPDMNDQSITPAQVQLDQSRFVVNGRPFNGTGIGYDASSRKLDLPKGTRLPSGKKVYYPYALLTTSDPTSPYELSLKFFSSKSNRGEPDEGYDIPDFHNLFLATTPTLPIPEGKEGVLGNPNDPLQQVPIPSFHRPALINYWYNKLSTDLSVSLSDVRHPYGPDARAGTDDDPALDSDAVEEIVDLKRRIMMRPIREDHPYFDGSNVKSMSAGLTDVYGPWDVDNNSDGVPDSIWVDIGLPIKTAPDGRKYRPLIAYLCTDLDGRVNLNIHGHDKAPEATFIEPTLAGGSRTDNLNLPKGFGYGPPEIDISLLHTNLTLDRATVGTVAGNLRDRYGRPNPTLTAIAPVPGRVATNDAFDQIVEKTFYDQPDHYWSAMNDVASAFGSPPDLHGLVSFGINAYGQPRYRRVRSNLNKNKFDTKRGSVYELGLSLFSPRGELGAAARDSAFSIAELEPILRHYDDDAQLLPSRLQRLASVNKFSELSTQITTENYDLPVPNVTSTDDLRSKGEHFPQNFAALLAKRLENGNVKKNDINREVKKMLSPDVMMGLRMNLNRPIGNGKDDNGNFVVDEPSEAKSNETLFAAGDGMLRNERFDHDNDGDVESDPDAYLARYHLARHLYVMMMTLKNSDSDIDFDMGILPLVPDPSPVPDRTSAQIETAIGIAQWAVNVVDFRDADSIMTAFEFDANPFNGWDVDGDISQLSDDNGHNDRLVVWGCERPELLITETLATHDRNTEDTDEDPDGKKTDDDIDPDEDFDQKRRPTGSCFIELYNPSEGDGRPPAEFYYNHVTGNWANGVMLDKMAPGTNSPIWRLIVVKGKGKRRDPDVQDDRLNRLNDERFKQLDPSDIERSIYFTNGGDPQNGDGDVEYYTTQPVFPIAPGKFAVLGSGELVGNKFVTYFGQKKPTPDPNTTRRIELDPSQNPNNGNNNTVVVVEPDNDNSSVSWTASHRPVAIVIDAVEPASNSGFNVSEPTDDRYNKDWDPVSKLYNPVDNKPRDAIRADLGDDITDENALMKDGIIDNFRTVHLQRLANPLLPHAPVENPYRTVDSAFINLSVFNGRTSDDDPGFPGKHTVSNRFTTVQRGDFDDRNSHWLWPSEIGRVWRNQINSEPGDGTYVPRYMNNGQNKIIFQGSGDHYFDYHLMHTLGYLNRNYGPPGTNPEDGTPWEAPLETPFPWLTWLNRPYVSQYELMQVPKTSSARLLAMFSVKKPGSPYSPATIDPDHVPFGHLLNFFQSTENPNNQPSANPNPASQLFRIFEYTHVPSRFVSTNFDLDSGTFTGGTTENDGRSHFHPPFNQISKYRDPGKININTVSTANVWNAILAGYQSPNFNQIIQSRRGYGAPAEPMLKLNPKFPTFFANPFRSPGTARLAPIPELEAPHEAAVTMMRPSGTFENPEQEPLFANTSTVTYGLHNDPNRNSYFHYQGLQRLANLVTTRSNVFAIWITVGYFEIVPHPDNNTPSLGAELGLDTGNVKRHRGFYVVDRSIPVAFQPGQNHNMERAVLLRRFIE